MKRPPEQFSPISAGRLQPMLLNVFFAIWHSGIAPLPVYLKPALPVPPITPHSVSTTFRLSPYRMITMTA